MKEKLDRKEIKNNSHRHLNRNYIMGILVIFLFSAVMNNTYIYSTKTISNNKDAIEIHEKVYDKDTKTVDFKKLNDEEKELNNKKMKGVLAPIVGRLGISISPIYNFTYSMKLFIYEKNISGGIFSMFIAFISLLIFLFVKLVLEVGKNRFYLESRVYRKTSPLRLLFPYKVKGTTRLSMILLLKDIYLFLWTFTIAGLFIKLYEYQMIPYILAENPTISRKDAFKLSKELMYGYKWEAFKLDMSLIGWVFLGLGTLGISNILYFDAYKESIEAELYAYLRSIKKNELSKPELLNDDALFDEKTRKTIYPEEEFKPPVKHIKINTDYNQKYSIQNLILLFFTVSLIGYLYEVSIHIIRDGQLVNRGTMYGPWLPIYGTGALLILVVLKPFRKNPFMLFGASMVLAGVVEYISSWLLQTFAHNKWWDYSGYFLNLNGRICLEGLLVFGLGGAVIIYFIGPLLNSLFSKINYRKTTIICAVLIALFGVDLAYSVVHPNAGKGITDYE